MKHLVSPMLRLAVQSLWAASLQYTMLMSVGDTLRLRCAASAVNAGPLMREHERRVPR
jgi:hypothetical protein